MVGVGLIAGLFSRDYSFRQWLWILLLSLAAIDVGFVFFEPQLDWYVGLSGVLHGALAAGAVAWWCHERRLLRRSLTAVLVGKLAWEQWHGALPLSGDMPVIVDAHLYGAIGGLIAALLWAVFATLVSTASAAIIARRFPSQVWNGVCVRVSGAGVAIHWDAERARGRRAARAGDVCRSVRSTGLRLVEALSGRT